MHHVCLFFLPCSVEFVSLVGFASFEFVGKSTVIFSRDDAIDLGFFVFLDVLGDT